MKKEQHRPTKRKTAPGEIERIGKDEMTLVEYPFASLQKERDARVIELRWDTKHPVSGKPLEASWRVAGDPQLGLPTANDERVYLVLMELTREVGWTQEVAFERRDLLKRLGWTTGKESYRMLQDAFIRLKSVSIHAQNAFYNSQNGWLYNGYFNLLDEAFIANEGPGRKKKEQEPQSFFRWSSTLHKAFLAGNIRTLDLEFALSLKRPLSLRLFRYLDKRSYDGKKTYQISLRELCEMHLGMVVDGRYESNLQASLNPAHAELVERGYLVSATYEPMKTRKGGKVCYTFGRKRSLFAVDSRMSLPAPAEPASNPFTEQFPDQTLPGLVFDKESQESQMGAQQLSPKANVHAPQRSQESDLQCMSLQSSSKPIPQSIFELNKASEPSEASKPNQESKSNQASKSNQGSKSNQASELIEAMVKVNVSQSVAEEIVASKPADQILLQLDCLADREPKNAPATLVSAIRQGWAPPAAYIARQEAEAQTVAAQKRRKQQALQKAEAARLKTEKEAAEKAENDALDALFERLPTSKQQHIDHIVGERLQFVLEHVGRAAAKNAWQATRRQVMREQGIGVQDIGVQDITQTALQESAGSLKSISLEPGAVEGVGDGQPGEPDLREHDPEEAALLRKRTLLAKDHQLDLFFDTLEESAQERINTAVRHKFEAAGMGEPNLKPSAAKGVRRTILRQMIESGELAV